MSQDCFRTMAKNELSNVSERGSRFWSKAEIMTPTWYMVEVCPENLDNVETRRWVTASIYDAAQIQQSCKPFRWAQIFVCLRAPLSIRNGLIFEAIEEAYVLPGTGNVVLNLSNGLSFQTNYVDPITGLQKAAGQVTLLYAREQNGSPLT